MHSHKFTAIAACDPNGVIGKDGNIPWDLPEEKAVFSKATLHQVMIMGYATYLSMPDRCFKDRDCYILTKSHAENVKRGVPVSAISELNLTDKKTNFVIGGEAIYRLFFSQGLIQSALISYINERYEGDRYFPLEFIKAWTRCEILRTPKFKVVAYEN